MLGNGHDISGWRIGHPDSPLGTRFDIDIVVTNAWLLDQLERSLATKSFPMRLKVQVPRTTSAFAKVLSDMSIVLARFNIHHITVQLERDSRRAHEPEHF